MTVVRSGDPAAVHLDLRRHDAAGTLHLKELMLNVYRESHAEPIRHDPWLSEAKFWQRLVEMYAPSRDFGMVGGWLGHELIGYAFGSPRDNDAATWQQARAEWPDLPAPDPIPPVYIFREFAVHPDHQGKGYGRQIHDALLGDRPESLASLLVRQDNEPATGAYTSWGWRKTGVKQPFPDSPVMNLMARLLPLS